MIFRIKKRDLVIVVFVLILLIPIVYAAGNIVIEAGFGVEIWIGNIGPTMMFDNSSSCTLLGTDPTVGGTKLVWFVFNVTDNNGEDDINETHMFFNITLGKAGEGPMRTNATCTNISKDTTKNMVRFNCSVKMWYFDNASSNWNLSATAQDVAKSTVTNHSTMFTYNELSSLNFPVAWINFSSLALGATDQASTALILNNTGNDDFDQVNITAAALWGVDTTTESIGADAFYVNCSDKTAGSGMQLSTSAQNIPNSAQDGNLTLLHGHTLAATNYTGYTDTVISTKGNQSLYFWVDVPSSGISQQKYNNTWNITVIDASAIP